MGAPKPHQLRFKRARIDKNGPEKDSMMRAMDYIKTLNEAIRYIEAHLENGLTYADVAEHVAISPYHFMIAGTSISTRERC